MYSIIGYIIQINFIMNFISWGTLPKFISDPTFIFGSKFIF